MIPISTTVTVILGTSWVSTHITTFTLLGKSFSSSLENTTTSQDLVNSSSVHICKVLRSLKFDHQATSGPAEIRITINKHIYEGKFLSEHFRLPNCFDPNTPILIKIMHDVVTETNVANMGQS